MALCEMAEATLYFSRSKSASTPRTLALHWEVAPMYTEPKSVGPVNTCFSCECTPHIACHECKVLHCTLHASVFCQSEICVRLRQFWAANFAAAVVATFAVKTFPGVWIFRKWYVVPPQYPQNADDQLRNDQEFCTKLQGELKRALFEGGRRTEPYIYQGRLDFHACLLCLFVSSWHRCWP